MNHSSFPSDNLIQLLFALPPQLISFLLISSKPIHLLSQLSLILQWSHPLGPYPSWILLFSYQALILSSHFILYYAIPNLICLSIISINLFSHYQQQQRTRVIHPSKTSLSSHPIALLDSLQSFQILVDHVSIISSRLNPIYQIFICSDPKKSIQALRTCLTSIPFSVIITYLIPPRFILLFIGSILIVWSSNWFQLLINLLWKSLLLRFSLKLLIDLSLHARFHPITLLHQLDPSLENKNPTESFYDALVYLRTLLKFNLPNLSRFQIQPNDESDTRYSLDPSQDIEFCLTIFENQRWWMGLDWTSNLLPHERPNWSDSLNHAVPSPASITLPSPKTFKDTTQNLQRRVEWKWIDSDWKIIEAHNISKEEEQSNQADEPSRSNATIITTTEKLTGSTSNQASSPNASFRRHQNRSSTSHSSSSACLSACLDSEIIDESLRASGLNAIVGAHDPTKPWDVDANGWQYGGNHWEKMSKKSGIGKYTRRRAWARRACLMTRLEPLEFNSSSSKDLLSMDSPLLPSPSAVPSSDSDSHSVSTLLDQISSQSSNATTISPLTPTSVSSSLKSKKSNGLLRRKK